MVKELKLQPRVLVVTERGLGEQCSLSTAYKTVEYRFVATESPTGLSAWEEPCDEGRNSLINVLEQCESLAGGFRQQALNRIIGPILLRDKVDVLLIFGLTGATVDLPRIAAILNITTVWVCESAPEVDPITRLWLDDAQCSARLVSRDAPSLEVEVAIREVVGSGEALKKSNQFDYADYEFCQRDHPLLSQMQAIDVTHFSGCKRVLDVGCGVGIFLEQLRHHHIEGVGVERNSKIAQYGRGMGFNIITDDALNFLRETPDCFDGVYCSHFVEHLPFDGVQKLLSLLAERLSPEGILVLTFPDPESIRSQLLAFWRDPEHVRFYHPELIRGVVESMGLVCEWTSYDDQPHELIPFSNSPDIIAPLSAIPVSSDLRKLKVEGFWEKMMARFGWLSAEKVQQKQQLWQEKIGHLLSEQNSALKQLTARTDTLWAINKTWSWNDNVTLKFRKK